MTRSYAANAINDPELAQRIRDRIAGKPLAPAVAKAQKGPPRPKAMVTQLHRVYTATHTHVIQLPVHLEQSQIREFCPPPSMSGERVKQVLYARKHEYRRRRDGIAEQLERYFPNGIPTLRSIDYVRFSMYAGGPKQMDDDNLGGVFKPVRDALCNYARHGREWRQHADTIGNADGWLKQLGVTWDYQQRKYEANPRAHGIQLILHCAPPSSE